MSEKVIKSLMSCLYAVEWKIYSLHSHHKIQLLFQNIYKKNNDFEILGRWGGFMKTLLIILYK